MDTKLKPCPFCGGAAHIEADGSTARLYAQHADECFFEADDAMRGLQDHSGNASFTLATEWNRRSTPPSPSTAEDEIAMLARKLVECYPDTLPNMYCDGEPVGRRLVDACGRAVLAAKTPAPAEGELPALPEPDHSLDCGMQPFYRLDQMREYAQVAIAADRLAREGTGSIEETKQLWETALSHAAMYVDAHCVDGETHAQHIMEMARPKFTAVPLSTEPQAGAVPDGWKLVPIEPTEAMVHAGEDIEPPRPFGKVYRAMIAAAPAPAQQPEKGERDE